VEDNTTATLNPGTDDGAVDFGETQGNETDTSANPDSGDTKAEGQEQTATAPTHRSLSELNAAFAEGEDISEEENDRILLAARKGLKTDEEIDAFLSKSKAAKAVKEDGKEKKPAAGKAIETDKKVPAKAAVPEDDPLARLVKEINPTKPDPEEALKSYKALSADHRKKGERLNTLDNLAKEVGFDGAEAMIERAFKMEERLETMLKTPEGRAQLFKAYGVTEDAPAGKAGAEGKGKDVPEVEELDDEEFPQGSKIKAVMAKMATDIESRIEAKYADKYGKMDKTFGDIKAKIEHEESERQVENLRNEALSDADEISQYMGRFEPELTLKDSASKIFSESVQVVYKEGRKLYVPKKDAHPEWPTLSKILTLRKDEYLRSKAGNVRQWIGEKVLSTGKLFELTTTAGAKARADMLTKQRQKLQPSGVTKGVAQPTDLFKAPESQADIDNMTDDQLREFRRRVLSGEIKVKF
jgi:hypothetical protein